MLLQFFSVSSKIIRALEFMPKNSYLMLFYEINISQVMIFKLDAVYYNKHKMKKNWQSNQRKTTSIIASARKILLPTVYTKESVS